MFVWVESRAKEPIVPLDLFRNRTYSVSILAAFLASFGFFGAIIFLPRWYQVVNGSTATESGYQLLPLLGGLILGSILSGQFVSRTGRYKWLTVAALSLLTGSLLLMTSLHADTPTADAVGLAVPRRPGHRPDDGRVHDHRPELGARGRSSVRRQAT